MTHRQRRDRRATMAEAHKSGKTITEVARQFGVTVNCVQGACREHDVILCKPAQVRLRMPRLLSLSTYRIIALLQNTNDTGLAIATLVDVQHQWVYKILANARKAGIKFPNREKEETPNAT